MSIFTANPCFSASIHDSACDAFSLPIESGDIEIVNKPWGVMVNILSGVNAGWYDASFSNDTYIFIAA